MSRTTLSVLLLAFICCGWPIIFYVLVTWIKRRDWSSSGDVLSKLIAMIFQNGEE